MDMSIKSRGRPQFCFDFRYSLAVQGIKSGKEWRCDISLGTI